MSNHNDDLTIRDPIHGMMIFPSDSIVRKLIDTREFQRLRRIKQLGFSDFVYPGATHTRFSHSLGVAWLVQKAVRQLFSRSKEDGGIEVKDFERYESEEQVVDAMACAGLLHDIGHGPFSHSFEKLTGTKDHETRGEDIIRSQDTEVNRVLKKAISSEILPNDIEDDLVGLIKGSFNTGLRKISSLIHSQLDCDRLDYLLRDTFFCGTPVHVDVDFIFRSMIIKEIPILNNEPRVVFEKKAVSAIELYLISRLHHYKNIAYHKTTGAAEALFYKIMELTDLFQNIFAEIDTNEFLSYDENKILNSISEIEKDNTKKRIIRRLCTMFLGRHLPKKFVSNQYNTQGKNKEDKIKFLDTEEKKNGNFYTEKFYSILNISKGGSDDPPSKRIDIQNFVYTNVNNSKYLYNGHVRAIKRLSEKLQNYPEKENDLTLVLEDVIFIFDKGAKEDLKILDITKHSKAVASSNIDAIENSINTYTLQRMKKKFEQERR